MKLKKEVPLNFDQVYHDFEPLIRSLLNKWQLGFDQDEYLQIGRIALYEAWCRYDPQKGPFPGYAKAYVKGYLLIAIQDHVKRNEHFQLTEPLTLTDTAPVSADESLEEIYSLIRTARLSRREKTWVIETIIHQLKPREIAEKYNVKISTVHTWKKEATKKLKKSLSKEWG
ncbi:sigma-70 family RNA polymerase sigma factor [Alteribacter populi]|uniref:sigma-70 family RNA polymerase sigma factor n=1 Tax=Alteribacter populi TaxID=2011011 RepID=UPI0012FE53D9|nr:sigma-70 family RNA polymerase sigma factor [Alteribacter populi]